MPPSQGCQEVLRGHGCHAFSWLRGNPQCVSACAVGDLPVIIKQKAVPVWSCYIDTEYLSKEIKKLKAVGAFGKGARKCSNYAKSQFEC